MRGAEASKIPGPAEAAETEPTPRSPSSCAKMREPLFQHNRLFGLPADRESVPLSSAARLSAGWIGLAGFGFGVTQLRGLQARR